MCDTHALAQHVALTWPNEKISRIVDTNKENVGSCCEESLTVVKLCLTSANTSQQLATGWLNEKMLGDPTMLRLVARRNISRLAGALEKFSKSLYGTTEGTYSERIFRPVINKRLSTHVLVATWNPTFSRSRLRDNGKSQRVVHAQ